MPLAAIELVLAQRSISSQVVDNLNASIHVRALLTDLFLIDEILKTPTADSRTRPIRSCSHAAHVVCRAGTRAPFGDLLNSITTPGDHVLAVKTTFWLAVH
jgi:hypothetical protein